MDFENLTGREIYKNLEAERRPFIDKGVACSKLTLPSLFPRVDRNPGQPFPSPLQGMGARGVTHLSAQLLLTFMPTATEFFRLVPNAIANRTLEEQGAEDVQQIEKALSVWEKEARNVLDTEGYRVAGHEIIQHLVVVGSALQYTPKDGGLEMFPLHKYVVKYDPDNKTILALVLREKHNFHALTDDVRKLAMQGEKDHSNSINGEEETVDIYTRVVLMKRNGKRKKYSVYQEVNGMRIPSTASEKFEEDLEYLPIRWKRIHGEAYGESLVSQYHDDLATLENLHVAFAEGSLTMLRINALVNPTGMTDPQELNDAENGDFVYGLEQDVSFLHLQKGADYNVALQYMQMLEERLKAAFLLNSAASRDAERVTALEFDFRAKEFESALGGVYSLLNQEWILPLVTRILKRLQADGVIETINKELAKHIKPVIVAGLDSLGRSQELAKFQNAMQVVQGIAGPEQVASVTNLESIIDFALRAAGIKIEGLFKTEEQVQQEQQALQAQQALQTVIEKGTGPAINAGAQGQLDPEALQAIIPQ